MSIPQRGTALVISIAAALSATGTGVPTGSVCADDGLQAVFYVSPDGSDSGDGTLGSPFATLERARDEVRKINGSMTGDIIVYLRGGDYRVTQPVEFDTRDSGRNGCRIRYEAYKGETPVINGAQKVTGWKKYNDKLWSAPLERDTKLRNLYVNDRRADMGSVQVQAKGGYGDYYVQAGQADWAWDSGRKSDGIVYDAGSMPRITSNFDDLEVVNGTTWNENIVCSRDIKYDGGSMILLMQQPYGAIAQTPGWGAGFTTGGTHTIYNAFSFVDSEGEFFFDKTEKVLYYYPRSGEDMTTADVEAPIADGLVKIAGKSTSDRVEDITFSGITFANTDYQLTDVAGSHGKTTCQAAQCYTAFADSDWHSKKYEMVDTLPAAVHITNSSGIRLTGNIVKHTGADGISMTNDVIDSEVSGNFVTDITSSGITIGHPQHIYIGDGDGSNREKFPWGVEGICKNDLITQNFLYDISVVHGFGGCAAITAYFVDSVRILSNTVEKTAYNGIHLGWGWCNFKDSTTCRDNQICYNRVINSLNRLHDSGGIYTIGQMPGTVINENYIQGIPAGGFGAPTYGLHNDEGTTYIEENDNVLEISPNVTYTINCEEYGDKHHLTIKRTYATVNKMGKNPPYSDIDTPIVVSDNVWPFRQYKICLNSGISDEYRGLMPAWLRSAADYVFPASCETTCGSKLPVRKTDGTVWIAPDGTDSFKAGTDMTKANGNTGSVKTPSKEGEYRIYILDANGKILSKSEHILRLSGTGSAGEENVIQAEDCDYNSGTETENCAEGGLNVGFIENGDYIGFRDIDLTNAKTADFRLASNGAEAAIEVRLDAPDGKLISRMDVKGTGDWQKWSTQTCNIEETAGRHDVYLVFTGEEGYLFNINWWKPNKPDEEYIPGDLNGDGVVDIFDLTQMRRAVLNGDSERFGAADINGDEVIDGDDLTLLRKFIMGEIKSFE
ncbi:carbohydrate-binding protein [Ruminococcus sp.]|uniref:carbohydrate-binding protein n=1 Tax=Ruminococcus sp. TaxID=41978 RepID=UPI0025D412E5|nr:carbohydrate-binding protein [Ruminococcus sp.]